MTITYGAVGTLATGATSITPAMPAGVAAGQLAVLEVVSAHTDASTPTVPSGWTLAGSFSGGGGSYGAGTGPRRLTFFCRVLVGGDVAPTTSLPAGDANSVIAGRVYRLTRSAGTGWRWTAAFGEDTSSGTGLSAVSADTPTWAAGDYALIGYAIALNSVTMSAEAISASGVTYGTVTERADDAAAVGHGVHLGTATCNVTGGGVAAAPTLSATLSAGSTGVAGVLRIREASSAIAVSEQSVFPPRNLVSLTGLAAEDVVSATIERQVGTDRTAVRAASSVDVTNEDVLLRIDAEQPFGVAVTYIATLLDVAGSRWELVSSSITSTVDKDVVSDAVRGIGAAVRIKPPFDKGRTRGAAQFNINGRIVVVGKKRSSPSTTATVQTETDADGDALEAVLDDATQGIILIRAQNTLPRLDGHYALLDDNEVPNWYDAYRNWTLELVRDEPWADVLEAAGYTLADIANNFTILQDIADFFTGETLLDIALHDFGA